MHGATSPEFLVLLVTAQLAAGAAVLWAFAATVWRRQLRTAGRPTLPAPDRPPAGLSRLIPVGTQVDEEFHRGFALLDGWLRERRASGS